MSLINEALKKAQRQRSLDNAPLSSAPSGVAAAAVTTHVRAASHRRSSAPVYFGLGLLGLGVVSTVVVMRYGVAPESPAPVTIVPTSVASTPPVAVAPVAPTTAETVGSKSAEVVTVTMPLAAPAPKAPEPVATPTVVSPPDAASVVAEKTPVSPPSVVAAPPKPKPTGPTDAEREARAQAFISTVRLTGVRGLGAQARVLMNEKVYRLDDIVEPGIPLRLSAVRAGLLVFTDGKGRTYEKTY
ncbi:MAG: hypothetical protein NTU80_11880 [Verrucomicrobia bacterium]|nr:hypothetical protein [Verrucomicrobiota bacterium]